MVKLINPSGNANPSWLTVVTPSNILYFAADDGTHGFQLWKSDGFTAGTAVVKNFSTEGIDPAWLTNVAGQLYFTADGGADGRELWTSDGTGPGTGLVMDINPGGGDSSPTELTVANGSFYFAADDGEFGNELWISSSTTITRVKDINLGGNNSDPAGLTAIGIGSELYFAANDGSHGTQLWQSDGTSGSTFMVGGVPPVINPNGNANIANLIMMGGILYFSADDGVHGRELWR